MRYKYICKVADFMVHHWRFPRRESGGILYEGEVILLTSFRRKQTRFWNALSNQNAMNSRGDFTMSLHSVVISFMAIGIGTLSACIAFLLLRLIGLITNLAFYQRWDVALVSPSGNTLGLAVILVPVAGSLVVGFLARYGSERIRGHGIPEALEAILINGSRIEPKVALLKPIASAIAIGTGGPFGAEGPIIMTGGAFGSMIAQCFHLTSTERKVLLVAGAAGGMAAIFNTPIAATLLAVELLLFEWKPRSLFPVALASATATIVRSYLPGPGMGPDALFAIPSHMPVWGVSPLLACVLVGVLAGLLASLLTVAVYASEDLFHKLPIHWMWWPLIGGVVIGVGGIIYPPALGVGYDLIHQMLLGNVTLQMILGLLIVKSIMWAVSLSSGTSGGVLAPLLLIGGALGGLENLFLPHVFPGFWPLMSMTSVLGAAIGCPLTCVIFAIELTRDITVSLPLLITTIVAYGLIVLVMRRSILTEKISRRGLHVSREYEPDPLEVLLVREVMNTNVVALNDAMSSRDLRKLLGSVTRKDVAVLAFRHQKQRLYPVLDAKKRLIGVVTSQDLKKLPYEGENAHNDRNNLGQGGAVDTEQVDKISSVLRSDPVVAYQNESLHSAIYRMASCGYTCLPVVDRGCPEQLLGLLSLQDLIKVSSRKLDEERCRERILKLRLLFPRDMLAP
jgi:chloride channel protein, CIC family